MIINECTKETRTTKPRNKTKDHTKLDLASVDPNPSMKSIVDNSIKDALKTLTGSINKVVAEDPEIKKHKHNISQLQTENLRLT